LDHVQARILQAQVAQAEARLELVDEQLKRAHLRAPFDGVIISGDLSRSLGAPVERGQVLFEVAPLGDYRVALEIDEQDVADIAPGQHGRLMLTAVPEKAIALVVAKVLPVAITEQGHAHFGVEAYLESPPDYLRPGMRGIGKVAVGERPRAWIWAHRLIDWAQLSLWSWVP
jgi:multidrug efflux pump subunit AcrA (membrane-fusion protein)